MFGLRVLSLCILVFCVVVSTSCLQADATAKLFKFMEVKNAETASDADRNDVSGLCLQTANTCESTMSMKEVLRVQGNLFNVWLQHIKGVTKADVLRGMLKDVHNSEKATAIRIQ